MAVRKLSIEASAQDLTSITSKIYSEINADKRPYQERIVNQCLSEFASGRHSVLIESPTGSGKTVMAMTVAESIFRALDGKDGQADFLAVFITLRRENLEQAKNAHKKFGFTFPCIYVTQFEKEIPNATVMIVDEAHHDATSSMQKSYSMITPAFILGMTATPYRSDRLGLGFEKIIKDAGYYSLIRDGYLSKPDLFMLRKFTPQAVADAYISDAKLWGKTIIYFHTRAQCDEAQSIIAAAGLRSEVMVSDRPDRNEILDAFRAGEIPCLINMALLTEGLDIDDLETVFVRPSVKGLTMQMCGRVLRLCSKKEITKKIVQCVSSKHPFASYAPVKKRYIESMESKASSSNKWLGVGDSSTVDEVHQVVLALRVSAGMETETTSLLTNIKSGQQYETPLFRPKFKKAGRGKKQRPVVFSAA